MTNRQFLKFAPIYPIFEVKKKWAGNARDELKFVGVGGVLPNALSFRGRRLKNVSQRLENAEFQARLADGLEDDQARGHWKREVSKLKPQQENLARVTFFYKSTD